MVAWAPLASPDDCRSRLDELQREPKLRGIRHLIHDEADPHWIVRPPVLESLALLEDRDLILELPVVFPRHFDDVLELARSFPAAFDRDRPPRQAAARNGRHGGLGADAARDRRLSDNVSAKVSGLNTMIGRADWDADDLRRPTEVAVDCFGPDRLVAGSDWPVSLLNGSYAKVWDETMRVVHAVAPDGADRILGGTARTLYRLDDTHRPDLLPRARGAPWSR